MSKLNSALALTACIIQWRKTDQSNNPGIQIYKQWILLSKAGLVWETVSCPLIFVFLISHSSRNCSYSYIPLNEAKIYQTFFSRESGHVTNFWSIGQMWKYYVAASSNLPMEQMMGVLCKLIFVFFFCPADWDADIGQSWILDQENEGNHLKIEEKTGGGLRPLEV